MDKLRKGINSMLEDVEHDEDYERSWGSLDDDYDEDLKTLDDYTVFNQLYYPAWKKGRDNYVKGEEEDIWNRLDKHFELPKYEANKYDFAVNDKDKIVSLYERGELDGRGFGGWKREPKNLGQLKRRIK